MGVVWNESASAGTGDMDSEQRRMLMDRWYAFWRGFWRGVTMPGLVLVWGIALAVIAGMVMIRVRGCYIPVSFGVFDVDGTWVITENGDDEFFRLESEGRAFATMWYGSRGGTAGLWGPTWTRHVEEIGGYPRGSVDMAAARAALFDHMLADGWRLDPLLRTRDINRTGVNWAGHVINAASLFVLCAFVGSARRCFVKTMDRRTRRLLAGECPKCRYAIAGLPTPVCPECGERVE